MAIEVPGSAGLVLGICAVGLLVLFVGWGALNSFSLNLLSFVH